MVAQTEKDQVVGNYWLCASLLPRVRGEGRFKFSEGVWRKNSFSRGVIKGLKAFFPEKKCGPLKNKTGKFYKRIDAR